MLLWDSLMIVYFIYCKLTGRNKNLQIFVETHFILGYINVATNE